MGLLNAIGVMEAALLPTVSTLGDVGRQARDDDTRRSGHYGRPSVAGRAVNNYVKSRSSLRSHGVNWLTVRRRPGRPGPTAARKALFLLRSSSETQSSKIAATAFISRALLSPSSSESRKVICYLLITAPNSLNDSGV